VWLTSYSQNAWLLFSVTLTWLDSPERLQMISTFAVLGVAALIVTYAIALWLDAKWATGER